MNILILTPIYPGPGVDSNFTKVVHYFAKEWAHLGENIQVVALPSYFPKLFYYSPKWIKKLINKAFGAPLPNERNSLPIEYKYEGIPVFRTPLFKLFPRFTIRQKYLKSVEIKIGQYLKSKNFIPDIIVAHWPEPTLYFIDALKRIYKCPTCVVVHSNQIKRYDEYIESVDKWGYRRPSSVNTYFKRYYPQIKFSFRCCSGVPNLFVANIPHKNFDKISSYVYIGMMLPRKHPDKVIDAVSTYHKNQDFNLVMLGNGSMLNQLRSKVIKENINEKIFLPGRVSREKIITTLDVAQVFIMVSENEVFGLVYIEAMARGCIVIASKGEGMDGIICDNKNGFLVPAGNVMELKKCIAHIHSLSPKEREQISKNAIKTARSMTDKKVAIDYLNNLKQLVENEG